jgi:hypothetical protein
MTKPNFMAIPMLAGSAFVMLLFFAILFFILT